MLDFECKSLQKVPLFKGLDAKSLQLVAFAATRVTFEPGETVFERGEQGNAMYIVAEGEVECIAYRPDGSELPMTTFGPGRSFGEVSVLNNVERHYTFRATRRTVLLQICKNDFYELMREIPPFALSLARDLARRLDLVVQKYSELPQM